jgi:hypothetical protein
MFKSLKEFFVGKPKVEETPAEVPYKVEAVSGSAPDLITEPVVVIEPAPVVDEIRPETVTISVSDNMNVSIGPSDTINTITLTPPVDTITWPFPTVPTVETAVKEKRTVVKREETASKKKPAPAITATKTKPRKKK